MPVARRKNKFLLERYLDDVSFQMSRKLRRSNSTISTISDRRITSVTNPKVLFNMSLDILQFKRNAIELCNYVKSSLNDDVDEFFETPKDAFSCIQGLEHKWSLWKQNFALIEKDIGQLIEKYSREVENSAEQHPDNQTFVAVSDMDDDDDDELPEFPAHVLQEMKDILSGNFADTSMKPMQNEIRDRRRKNALSLVKREPADGDSNSNQSTILVDVTQYGMGNKSNADCDFSDDTLILDGEIPISRLLQDLDTNEVLDMIPDDDETNSDSLNLRLSSVTSQLSKGIEIIPKPKKNSKKTVDNNLISQLLNAHQDVIGRAECYVKITRKEKLLCDEKCSPRSKKLTKRASKLDDSGEESASSNSDSFKSHLSKWVRGNTSLRRRVITSDNEDLSASSMSSSSPRLSFNSSHDNDDGASSIVASNISDHSENEFSWSDSAGDSDVLNNITDLEESDNDSNRSNGSSDGNEDDNKRKLRSKTKTNGDSTKEKTEDPEAAWRRDPLLTGNLFDRLFNKPEQSTSTPTKLSLKKPMAMEDTESDDADVQFVSSIKRKLNARTDGSDTENGSPVKKGRRNIKEIITDENLTQATLKAKRNERERIERLKEKQTSLLQQLSQNLSGVSVDDDLILDACEGNMVVVHRKLTQELKEHQKCGVRFMWDNCYESVKRLNEDPGSGCILAHCMGLGKTLQVITLIHTLIKHPVTNTKKVLVICPLSTVLNWRKEFKMATDMVNDPLTDINIYYVNQSLTKIVERYQTVATWHRTGGVLLLGYEAFITIVQRDIPLMNQALLNPGPDLVVCDEGHLLKNGKANRTQVISKVNTKRRIIMTGTPMQNNLEEYYCMVAFVKPAFLGNHKEYRNRFINPIQNGQYNNSKPHDIQLMKKRSHVLHKMTKGFIQRYEVSELNQYLPKKYDYVLEVELDDLQVKLYKKYNDLCQTQQRLLFANCYILKLIWTHPRMLHLQQQRNEDNKKRKLKKKKSSANPIDDDTMADELPKIAENWWIDDLPLDVSENINYGRKFIVMMSIVKECVRLKEKLLIFTSSILELESIETFLKQDDPGWVSESTYYRMDGTVPIVQRDTYCRKFNETDNNISLFLLTPKVGGLGLNLTGANRVIIMDVSWNPTLDTQSIFRIYRLGQKKPCYIYRLVAKGTMEEVIYERSVTKQAISSRVVDEMQITRHFKLSEIIAMYRCEFDRSAIRPMPKLPEDTVLANLLQQHNFIYTYQDHNELLQNLPHEELDEEEMKLAWEEFEREKNFVPPVSNPQPSSSTFIPGSVMPAIDPLAATLPVNGKPQAMIILETEGGNVMVKYDQYGQPELPLGCENRISELQLQTARDMYSSTKALNNNRRSLPIIYIVGRDGLLQDLNRPVTNTQMKSYLQQHQDLERRTQHNSVRVPTITGTVNLVDDDLSLNGNENAVNPLDTPIIANYIPIDVED